MSKIILFLKAKKYVIISAIGIILVAALITCFVTFVLPSIKSGFSCSSSASDSAEDAVRKYYVALNTKDFEMLCNCYMPETADKLKKIVKNYKSTDEFFKQRIDAGLKDIYGDDVKFVVSDFSFDPQEITEEGICNGVDVKKLNVEKVTNVTVTVNVKGSKFETETKSLATVYCIKGKWYIVSMKDLDKNASTDSSLSVSK